MMFKKPINASQSTAMYTRVC